MVNNRQSPVDLIFHALSDPTRRALLRQLAEKQSSVGDLAAPYEQSLAGISKHLNVLEEAQLITKSRQGRVITCSANLAPLDKVHEVLEELGAYWRGRLDSLDQFLNQAEKPEETIHEHSSSRQHPTKARRTKSRKRRP